MTCDTWTFCSGKCNLRMVTCSQCVRLPHWVAYWIKVGSFNFTCQRHFMSHWKYYSARENTYIMSSVAREKFCQVWGNDSRDITWAQRGQHVNRKPQWGSGVWKTFTRQGGSVMHCGKCNLKCFWNLTHIRGGMSRPLLHWFWAFFKCLLQH